MKKKIALLMTALLATTTLYGCQKVNQAPTTEAVSEEAPDNPESPGSGLYFYPVNFRCLSLPPRRYIIGSRKGVAIHAQ